MLAFLAARLQTFIACKTAKSFSLKSREMRFDHEESPRGLEEDAVVTIAKAKNLRPLNSLKRVATAAAAAALSRSSEMKKNLIEIFTKCTSKFGNFKNCQLCFSFVGTASIGFQIRNSRARTKKTWKFQTKLHNGVFFCWAAEHYG